VVQVVVLYVHFLQSIPLPLIYLMQGVGEVVEMPLDVSGFYGDRVDVGV